MTKHRAGVWMMREEAWPVEEIPSTTRELLGRLDPILTWYLCFYKSGGFCVMRLAMSCCVAQHQMMTASDRRRINPSPPNLP